jgi:hypothetical protein
MTETDSEAVAIDRRPNLNDIREWGIVNGWEVPPTGRLPRGLKAAYLEANGIEPLGPVDPNTIEQAPRVAVDRTPVQRAKGLLSRSRPKATAKKRSHPRVSTENILSAFWSGLAFAVKPISLPTAKALMSEAPVAGMILDERLRGTFPDKLLQPLARMEDQGKAFGALLAPPMLTFLIDKFPQRTPYLLPLLRKSLMWHIEVVGPKMEEMAEREAEFEAKYGETVDTIINSFFYDPEVGGEE